MKTILVCFIALMSSLSAMAQHPDDRNAARKATEELAGVYGLSEDQVQKMYLIQELRFRNLAEVEPLKATDETLYRQKLKNIRIGMEASIERMLTPDQRPILERERVERRKREAAYLRELELSGASKEAIQQAMFEIEQ